MNPRMSRSWWNGLALWFGGFTALTILIFFYRYLDDLARGHRGTFLVRLIEETTGGYSAAILFFLVLKFIRRYRLERGTWFRRVPHYLAAAVIFSLLDTTSMAASRMVIFRLAGMGEYDYGIMPIRYLMEMANHLIFFALGVALVHLYDHYRESQARELRTAQLETQLAQAQLQALQAQIHPHFLFNALNTISSVIYEDVRAADTMIARLSEFLRRSVHAARGQEVTLEEELGFLNLYLDVMRPRFEERLQVKFDVEKGIESALLPRLILQPLVENSIKHAADPDSGQIDIAVMVSRSNGSLQMRVRDAGPGLAPEIGVGRRDGVGLANTAERLEKLYGQGQAFAIRNAVGGGVEVTVELPFHTTDAGRNRWSERP